MAEIYQAFVRLTMAGNAHGFMSALGAQVLHVHGQARALHGTLNQISRMRLAIGGGLAIAGGAATLKMMQGLVDKGNELIRVQRNMAQAGATAVQVEHADAESKRLTAIYKNIGRLEIMKSINDARGIFGDQDVATHEIEAIIKSASFLRAFQGEEKGKSSHAALMAELNAALKSGELAGKITPDEMSKHIEMLTAMKVAFGEQLKIGQYLTAQRAAGVALRNVDDRFRYGIFPALVQENGSGAGVMLMTAFNKVVAGVGNRAASVEQMLKHGIVKPEDVKYNKRGEVTGLRAPGVIANSYEAAMNFASWVMTTLAPKLSKDPITQAQQISAMFPDRNAAKAVTEIIQQWKKLNKDADLVYKSYAGIKDGGMSKYTDGSYDYQIQAFHEQWDNLLRAIGSSLVPMATENLRKLNEVMTGFAAWAGAAENAKTIEAITKGITVLGASLVGAGAVALIAALGPAGWLVLGIGALAAAVVAAQTMLAGGDRFSKTPGARTVQNDAIPGDERFGPNGGRDPVAAFLRPVTDFLAGLKSQLDALWDSIKAFAGSPETWRPLLIAIETTQKEFEAISAAAQRFVAQLHVFEVTKFVFGQIRRNVEWMLGWADQIAKLIGARAADPKFSQTPSRRGVQNDAIAGDERFKSPILGVDWGGDVVGQLTTKMLAALGEIVTKLGAEFASWPDRVSAAIAGMGAAITDKIKSVFTGVLDWLKSWLPGHGVPGAAPGVDANGLVPGGSPMNFRGGEGGAAIHRASFGGGVGANDNFGGGITGAAARGDYGGLRVKGGLGGQATAGGAMHPGLLEAAKAIQAQGGVNRFTAFNDHYHKGTRSLHAHGLAADVTGNAAQIMAGTRRAMAAAGLVEGRDYRMLNEYAHRSRRATGGHVHFEFRSRAAAEAYARSRRGTGTARAPTVGPPPPRPAETIHTAVHLDGRQIATAVARRMASAAKFPRHTGGMDTHGSWRPPGTTLSDAA